MHSLIGGCCWKLSSIGLGAANEGPVVNGYVQPGNEIESFVVGDSAGATILLGSGPELYARSSVGL